MKPGRQRLERLEGRKHGKAPEQGPRYSFAKIEYVPAPGRDRSREPDEEPGEGNPWLR